MGCTVDTVTVGGAGEDTVQHHTHVAGSKEYTQETYVRVYINIYINVRTVEYLSMYINVRICEYNWSSLCRHIYTALEMAYVCPERCT